MASITEGLSAYLTPEDSAAASIDQSDKALGWAIGELTQLYLEKRNLRFKIMATDDEEELGDLEFEMKLIRSEESSLHRIESGLQSRLKVGT